MKMKFSLGIMEKCFVVRIASPENVQKTQKGEPPKRDNENNSSKTGLVH